MSKDGIQIDEAFTKACDCSLLCSFLLCSWPYN